MDPIERVKSTLTRAEQSEPDVPTAMTLATIDAHGHPAARVVLLRGVDARGFVFFTNYNSDKARELEANPQAALCFHWKTLGEQLRVAGAAQRVSTAESDAYFASRPQESQLAALASDQSATLDCRATLERRFAELQAEHGTAPVARPEHWGGYRLVPQTIEFWTNHPHRLHQRELFTKTGSGWKTSLLYP